LSPLTTTLNYGPVQEDGTVVVRIIYDHRAMDGCTIARALAALEEVFNGELLQEMSRLCAGNDVPREKGTVPFPGRVPREAS
jgi:hypothetical protein